MRTSGNTIPINKTVKINATINNPQLARLVEKHFDMSELETLIFDLGYNKDNIEPTGTLQVRVRALVAKCRRENRLADLWQQCDKTKPKADWESALEAPKSPPDGDSGKRSWRGVLLAAAFVVILVFLGWSVWGNGRSPSNNEFPSLDQMLKHVQFLDFEDSMAIPSGITPLQDYYGASHMSELQISEGESAFYGIHSLSFEADLLPFEPDRNFAGISLMLNEQLPVDAVSAFVKIPYQEGLAGAENFYITFRTETETESGTEESQGHFSQKIQVPVGEWTPVFWGTGYANGVCTDEDESGECVEGGFFWDDWDSPEIKVLDIRIWRDGEEYVGPVYLDQITFYQRTALSD